MSWLRFRHRLFRTGRARGIAAPLQPRREAAPPETATPTPLVVIGLDFGTSGTKAVVRLLDGKGRPASAIDFGTDYPGFSRFSFPSTVALVGSRFLFGVDAEEHPTGTAFRSLKRELISTKGDGSHATAPPICPPPTKSLGAHPHFLVAVYLSVVLRQVRKLAEREYGPECEFLYNLDIPVSQLDGEAIQRGYQTSLDAAVDFAETDGLQLDDYRALWGRWLVVLGRESTGLSDKEHKRWELIPESLAIVKGAETASASGDGFASTLPKSRRYAAIVDIGAGTTDLAWFKWFTRSDSEDEDRVSYFSAETSLVGCDDVDHRLLDILGITERDRHRVLPVVREAKPRLHDEPVDVVEGYRSLCPEDLEQAAGQVARRCFDVYGESFGEAYKKEKNTKRWEEVCVILVGGGSQLDRFRRRFRRHPRPFGRLVDFRLPGHQPSERIPRQDLGALGMSSEAPADADMVFLLPALGLSHPPIEMPVPTLPDDIPPLPPGPRGPTGLYDYEAPDDD